MSTTENNLQQLTAVFMSIPFNRMLGLSLAKLDMEAKNVAMSFPMKDALIGNFLQGILHGGVISSVLDMAGGILIMANNIYTAADTNTDLAELVSNCSTIDLQISYLNPGRGTLFTAEAWLIKSGNHIGFTRMELRNDEDILIATANGTYKVK